MPKMTSTVDMARALLAEGVLDRSLAPDVERAAAGDRAAEQRLQEAIIEFAKAHPDGYEGTNIRFKIQDRAGTLSPGRRAMMSGNSPARHTWLINQLALRGVDRETAERMAPGFADVQDKDKLKQLLNSAAAEYKQRKAAGEAAPSAAASTPQLSGEFQQGSALLKGWEELMADPARRDGLRQAALRGEGEKYLNEAGVANMPADWRTRIFENSAVEGVVVRLGEHYSLPKFVLRGLAQAAASRYDTEDEIFSQAEKLAESYGATMAYFAERNAQNPNRMEAMATLRGIVDVAVVEYADELWELMDSVSVRQDEDPFQKTFIGIVRVKLKDELPQMREVIEKVLSKLKDEFGLEGEEIREVVSYAASMGDRDAVINNVAMFLKNREAVIGHLKGVELEWAAPDIARAVKFTETEEDAVRRADLFVKAVPGLVRQLVGMGLASLRNDTLAKEALYNETVYGRPAREFLAESAQVVKAALARVESKGLGRLGETLAFESAILSPGMEEAMVTLSHLEHIVDHVLPRLIESGASRDVALKITEAALGSVIARGGGEDAVRSHSSPQEVLAEAEKAYDGSVAQRDPVRGSVEGLREVLNNSALQEALRQAGMGERAIEQLGQIGAEQPSPGQPFIAPTDASNAITDFALGTEHDDYSGVLVSLIHAYNSVIDYFIKEQSFDLSRAYAVMDIIFRDDVAWVHDISQRVGGEPNSAQLMGQYIMQKLHQDGKMSEVQSMALVKRTQYEECHGERVRQLGQSARRIEVTTSGQAPRAAASTSVSVLSVPGIQEALEELGVPPAYVQGVITRAREIIIIEEQGVEGMEEGKVRFVALDVGAQFVKAMRLLAEIGVKRENAERMASEIASGMPYIGDADESVEVLRSRVEAAVGKHLSPEVVRKVHLEVEKQLFGLFGLMSEASEPVSDVSVPAAGVNRMGLPGAELKEVIRANFFTEGQDSWVFFDREVIPESTFKEIDRLIKRPDRDMMPVLEAFLSLLHTDEAHKSPDDVHGIFLASSKGNMPPLLVIAKRSFIEGEFLRAASDEAWGESWLEGRSLLHEKNFDRFQFVNSPQPFTQVVSGQEEWERRTGAVREGNGVELSNVGPLTDTDDSKIEMSKEVAERFNHVVNKLRLAGFRDYASQVAMFLCSGPEYDEQFVIRAAKLFQIALKYLVSEEVPDEPARSLAVITCMNIVEDQVFLNQKPEDVAPAVAQQKLKNYRMALEMLQEHGVTGEEAVAKALVVARVGQKAVAALMEEMMDDDDDSGSGGSTPSAPAGSDSGPVAPPARGGFDAAGRGMGDMLARSARAVHGSRQRAGSLGHVRSPLLRGAATAFGGMPVGARGLMISPMSRGTAPLARPIGL